MKIVQVSKDNFSILPVFVSNLGEAAKTFRYFSKRPIDIVYNHLVTILLVDEEQALAYGHLEEEDGNVWLGICVLPAYKGKGFGKIIMERLIEEAKKKGLQTISLTVDQDNLSAIGLYEKCGFKLCSEYNTNKKFQLRLN